MQETSVSLSWFAVVIISSSHLYNLQKMHKKLCFAKNSIIIHVTTFQNVFAFFIMKRSMMHACMHDETKKVKIKKHPMTPKLTRCYITALNLQKKNENET